MKRTLIALAMFFALSAGPLASGCIATVSFRATTPPTQLVSIGTGIWVVYDYSEPVFYANDAYWWWNGRAWYRSSYVDSGWVIVDVGRVPVVVRRVDRPHTYVHYRVSGSMRAVPPGHVRGHYVRGHDEGHGRGNDSDHDRGHDEHGRDHDDHGGGHGEHDHGNGHDDHDDGHDDHHDGGGHHDDDEHDDHHGGRGGGHDDDHGGGHDEDRGHGHGRGH